MVALFIAVIACLSSLSRFSECMSAPETGVFGGEKRISEEQKLASPAGIPRRLSFNYKNNILEDKKPSGLYKNLANTVSVYEEAWNDKENWNENETDSRVTVDFLTDKECREAVTQAEPRLLQYFNNETEGAFRSDICRIADLYLKGGFYMDNDMRSMEAVMLPDHITFSTVLENNEQNFFQSFLASTPKNPVLKKALQVMLGHYEGTHKIRREGRVYSGMGTATLKDAYDLAVKEDPSIGEKTRFLREINLRENPSLYMDVERQGIRPMCDIAVHYAETLKVYFYSRAIGTPKCGGDR